MYLKHKGRTGAPEKAVRGSTREGLCLALRRLTGPEPAPPEGMAAPQTPFPLTPDETLAQAGSHAEPLQSEACPDPSPGTQPWSGGLRPPSLHPSGQTCAASASQLVSYHDAGVGLVVVGGMHALEPLLACCVPKVCNMNTALTARRGQRGRKPRH